MAFKSTLRKKIIDISGYWIYKKATLPVGADIIIDLKTKISLDLKTIFDVGANIGQTALAYAKSFPEARILSFEPISFTFEKLEKNVKKNKNIEPYKLAFSDKKGTLDVKVFDGAQSVLNSLNDASMNNSEDAKIEQINTETIDAFLKSRGEDAVDLLKIDTEGGEKPVLKGAEETINSGKIKLIYLETGFSNKNERNSFFPDLLEFLEKKNYTFFGMYEVHHYDIKNQKHFGNALFIHNEYLGSIVNTNHY